MTRRVWIEPNGVTGEWTALHADPLIAELLYRRGFQSAHEVGAFLDPRPQPAPHPGAVPGMDAAIERVCRAIEAGERIAVFGDYDADGITATAILTLALWSATGDRTRVIPRLPRRREGYGLSIAAIDELATARTQLLVAIDCGSANHAEVAHARSLGLDVVVVDHHQMRDAGPEEAIVASTRLDPNADRRYADLTGAGLAYLLVVGLARHGCAVVGEGEAETDFLDLVALGTIADVARMTGLNRAFVRAGLERMRARSRLGLSQLLDRLRIEPDRLSARTIAFKIAPRLNAAGRIDDPLPALHLMLADDRHEAARLVDEIEGLNNRRKLESRRIEEEVELRLARRRDLETARLLVLSGSGWQSGVVGLVAARLAERYGRPAIVLHDDGETSSGSARSVDGFDITAALATCEELLDRHGGHSQAAGLSLRTERLADLEDRLDRLIALSDLVLPTKPTITIDVELPRRRLTLSTVDLLQSLEPFGPGNELPVFLIRGVLVREYATMGSDRSHLRFTVETGAGQAKVVMWGGADRSRELLFLPRIDIAATLDVDVWNGRPRLHVEALDFRPAS